VSIGTTDPGIARTYIQNDGTNVGLYVGNGTPFGQAKIELDGPAATHLWIAESGTRVFTVTAGGKVKIGSQIITSGAHQNAMLSVDGKIVSKSAFVTIQNWGDYVLHEDYKLPSLLNEVEPYIKENKHLIGVPSEKEILENGINLGEMDAIQMVKIEELMLYTIEQQKQIDELKKEVAALKGKKVNIFNSLFGYIFFGFLMAAILVLKKDSLFK